MIVGIDFSIKSPAVTVITNGGEFHFYTFARNSVAREDFFITLKNHGVNVVNIPDEAGLSKKALLTERERSSTADGIMQVESITQALSTWAFSEDDQVAIEGFSFGSTGNRLAQISGYQWLLRYLLCQNCKIPVGNLWFFSPMTIKATAGKGNFKKEEMIQAFLDQPLNNELHAGMKNHPAEFQNKKGAWLKPIDDICDSFWVAKTLMKTIATI